MIHEKVIYYCFSAYCSLYRAIAINMEQMLNQHKKAILLSES